MAAVWLLIDRASRHPPRDAFSWDGFYAVFFCVKLNSFSHRETSTFLTFPLNHASVCSLTALSSLMHAQFRAMPLGILSLLVRVISRSA